MTAPKHKSASTASAIPYALKRRSTASAGRAMNQKRTAQFITGGVF